jgi:phage anti-repressor protein
MPNELIKINYQEDRQAVSGRELHSVLKIESNYTTWFKRMTEYGFSEGTDFIPYLEESTGGRPSEDHQITIDMAKEIAMLQRSEEGKQLRLYFIDLEKKWNSPEQLMSRALKMADKTIMSLQNNVEVLDTENKLLSKQSVRWADRKILEALVKTYGSKIGFENAWRDFKKELLYEHSINLNARVTNYLNTSGKKTKPKLLSLIDDGELPSCISTAVALCRNNKVNIESILSKYQS